MKFCLGIFLFFSVIGHAQPFSVAEINQWKAQSKNVTIIRDNWGIPHVYGKSDADAVFGLIYAQCEDDFKRVELNYIEKLGRMSEIRGEAEIWNDLYIRMIIDSSEALAEYKKSPAWMKELLTAWAAGMNYYLHTHPESKPALISRFKPWYPLLWTDGSIGAISTGDIDAGDLKNFYTGMAQTASLKKRDEAKEVSGSNGFAVSPARTNSGHALLYINPHVTFYFRPEVQMSSEQGLQVYGAVTWGQFFIYQGFNQYCGWMHTSSNADVSDMYAETIVKKGEKYFYVYENAQKPVTEKKIRIKFKDGDVLKEKSFTAYSTHHGPVMAKRDGKWISVRSYNRSLNSLEQSWLRTKAKGLEDYKKVMDLRGNTSNNTVFADNKGNIAYWHGNYMPVRDSSLNWDKVVDGSVKSTEYKGMHTVDQTVHVYNPTSGWIQNCNSTPFTVSGTASPERKNYPAYMAPDGENFRAINAAKVLEKEKSFTIDKLITAGYDNYLSAFEILVPALIRNFDQHVPKGNMLYNEIAEAVDSLRNWDYRCTPNSVATTIAVEWGEKLNPSISRVYINAGEMDQTQATKYFADYAAPEDFFLALRGTLKDLTEKYGTWKMAWGEINRYQRLTGNIREIYDDSQPSLPVGFASATWGCLPSYNSRVMTGTKKRYGVSGNSFICAVEFGPRIKAKSLLAGGENSVPASPHFSDQAEMYTKGIFKEVLFYKEEVEKNARERYLPGEVRRQE
ncbi:penicillin acylase family protein [Pollutibacter soli]|uniref:penicillin acylase family protein n=1 Tax=Pollutibacter soli TaxID=3034157 RepID=UPI00301383FD